MRQNSAIDRYIHFNDQCHEKPSPGSITIKALPKPLHQLLSQSGEATPEEPGG